MTAVCVVHSRQHFAWAENLHGRLCAAGQLFQNSPPVCAVHFRQHFFWAGNPHARLCAAYQLFRSPPLVCAAHSRHHPFWAGSLRGRRAWNSLCAEATSQSESMRPPASQAHPHQNFSSVTIPRFVFRYLCADGSSRQHHFQNRSCVAHPRQHLWKGTSHRLPLQSHLHPTCWETGTLGRCVWISLLAGGPLQHHLFPPAACTVHSRQHFWIRTPRLLVSRSLCALPT
mmetsp:Transcript_79509/g.202590  ORF Transcript_79509/g.202590 Transcript_79509/m.202590 type:complete len:228 (-) Transcript_79509:162-845(-)